MKNSLPENLGEALTDTLREDSIAGISLDLAEAAFDTMLQSGVIQNIPVLNILYQTTGIALSVRDQIFSKKILKFLYETKNLSKEKRRQFMDKLEKKVGSSQKAGELLIIIVERLDDLEKAELIGFIFKKIAGDPPGGFTVDDFFVFVSLIDRIPIQALKQLPEYYPLDKSSTPYAIFLESAGLIRKRQAAGIPQPEGSELFHQTKYGQTLGDMMHQFMTRDK